MANTDSCEDSEGQVNFSASATSTLISKTGDLVKVTSLKPWPCRRFGEGGPAVLQTVVAEWSVFRKKRHTVAA